METGDLAHDLPLSLAGGEASTLSDFRGRWLVLYFYPKDNTPGCTTESRDFSALLPAFEQAGAAVIGVSRDSLRSHDGFRRKHDLGFALASDPDEHLCRGFDVIREKSLYGLRYIGVDRSTFLIDPHGRVAAAWRKVRVRGHAQAVLDRLRELQRPTG